MIFNCFKEKKYLHKYLTKIAQDLYAENNKMLTKEILIEKIYCVYGLQNTTQ